MTDSMMDANATGNYNSTIHDDDDDAVVNGDENFYLMLILYTPILFLVVFWTRNCIQVVQADYFSHYYISHGVEVDGTVVNLESGSMASEGDPVKWHKITLRCNVEGTTMERVFSTYNNYGQEEYEELHEASEKGEERIIKLLYIPGYPHSAHRKDELFDDNRRMSTMSTFQSVCDVVAPVITLIFVAFGFTMFSLLLGLGKDWRVDLFYILTLVICSTAPFVHSRFFGKHKRWYEHGRFLMLHNDSWVDVGSDGLVDGNNDCNNDKKNNVDSTGDGGGGLQMGCLLETTEHSEMSDNEEFSITLHSKI
mmetsp:Transcript_18518/g.23852  ORF Transcript_18518/g.23852 Transcript_18518/m.23852 type:complete len:309 (+) Transcript_18518:266-1192(+)